MTEVGKESDEQGKLTAQYDGRFYRRLYHEGHLS
jgi:hypothetical protein